MKETPTPLARSCRSCPSAGTLSGARYEHLNCLVATTDGEWWECDCGLPLAEPATIPATIACACGQEWRFDRWPIGPTPGSTDTTEVEPRRV